jgi:hypothetical protein
MTIFKREIQRFDLRYLCLALGSEQSTDGALDLTRLGKTFDPMLGEDQPPVQMYVEDTVRSADELGVYPELLLERCGQTGRAR